MFIHNQRMTSDISFNIQNFNKEASDQFRNTCEITRSTIPRTVSYNPRIRTITYDTSKKQIKKTNSFHKDVTNSSIYSIYDVPVNTAGNSPDLSQDTSVRWNISIVPSTIFHNGCTKTIESIWAGALPRFLLKNNAYPY